MSLDFADWAAQLRQLDEAITALVPAAVRIGVPTPAGQEWFELLEHKLRPQLETEPFLVVAIVGGTNIGKSLLFNHLAGEVASAVSPLAAGTKHPVCLTPSGASDGDMLARLFENFQLKPWRSADEALEETPENLLFWRVGRNVPQRLLLLDAPDVDSDAKVNWQRAHAIRQAADVLVAVLTQQKYNDAAVKQFFREAVQADKPIIAVFNQIDLEDDRAYWPLWLDTFRAQTGATPELVYVVPLDRAAAKELRLPFYAVGADGRQEPAGPSSLREELAAMHFDAIKIRTLRGALTRVLDADKGAGAYLATIRAAAADFAAARDALSATEMARVAWPSLPPRVLVNEIGTWWDVSRSAWSRNIHGFYRTIGQGVTWPVRTLWNMSQPEGVDPLDGFRRQERGAIVLAVEKMLDELDRLAQVGNETLRPRLMALLSGHSREKLLAHIEEAHAELPAVDDDYRAFLRAELDAWRERNPRAVIFLRSLDHAAALARPAITITLAVSGWVVAGDLVVQAAGHTAVELAREAAITGGITVGGEAVVSTTSEGVRQAAGRLFGRLQSQYAQRRAAWLARWLERELLGDLLAELRQGAEVPESPAFVRVEEGLEQLQGEKDEGRRTKDEGLRTKD
jgi:hypothetical protein